MTMRLLICSGLILLLSSCTKQLPIEPMYSDDTNWTPYAYPERYGYNRVRLSFSLVPRQELLRNIDSYLIRITDVATDSAAVLDTMSGTSIGWGRTAPYSSLWYTTPPFLREAREYAISITINYRQGISRTSSGGSFVMPLERSAILKQLPLPDSSPDVQWYEDGLAFAGGKLFVLRGYDSHLYSIDTSSGQGVLLSTSFLANSNAIHDLSATEKYLFSSLGSYNVGTEIVRYDLQTGMSDTASFPSNGWNSFGSCGISGDSVGALLLLYGNNRMRFISVDISNGDTLALFPESPPPARMDPFYMVAVDSSVWVSQRDDFDNRLMEYDRSTFSILSQQRNPVFQTSGLAWDGSNFWVIDKETQTICKIQLGGL